MSRRETGRSARKSATGQAAATTGRGSSPMARGTFSLLFGVMLANAAGNTALQSTMPALGRSTGVPDTWIALSFSVSSLLWVLAAPYWAGRSNQKGRRAMLLLGLAGFALSNLVCGLALTAGVAGLVSSGAAFLGFVAGRTLYGALGAAAPPSAQALVAAGTSRRERTRALSLLTSAFGLGTVIGPALAPFFVLPFVGLAGPAYVFAVVGVVICALVLFRIPDDRRLSGAADHAHGATMGYPSIGGQGTGASVTAALGRPGGHVAWRDPRLLNWHVVGVIMAHAQAMVGQTMAFLTIDRLGLPLGDAQQAIGVVLMTGAGATLLAQWGLIPMLGLSPRMMVISGLGIAAVGTLSIIPADSLLALALSYAFASLGFGILRPGYAAGASLAVSNEEQAAAAGKVTAVNGSAFIVGPAIGVALYQFGQFLPYALSAAILAVTLLIATRRLKDSAVSG